MWSILENVPCAREKKVYSSAIEWNVLKIPVRSTWSNVSFKACVSLLIFSLPIPGLYSEDLTPVGSHPTQLTQAKAGMIESF